MKSMKIIALIAFTVASITSQFAQAAKNTKPVASSSTSKAERWYNNRAPIDRSTYNLGMHFGPTFNTASISSSAQTSPDVNSRTRLGFGITNEINIFSWFGIQPELNYMQKGAEVSTTPNNNNARTIYSLNYLEIPLLAKVRFEPLSGFRPFFMTGPTIGFLLGKSASQIDTTGRETKVASNTINNNFETVNFAWNFALGTDIDVSDRWSVVLDTRYSAGISNILTNRGQNGDRDSSTSLSGFQILAGIKTSML